MCLDLSMDVSKRKPRSVRCRKFAYKVVTKYDDTNFVSLHMDLYEKKRFVLGKKVESSRVSTDLELFERIHCIVSEGFHFFNNLKDARRMANRVNHPSYGYARRYGIGISIIKCKVEYADHVADGTFLMDYHANSSVYTKTIPIEEIEAQSFRNINEAVWI